MERLKTWRGVEANESEVAKPLFAFKHPSQVRWQIPVPQKSLWTLPELRATSFRFLRITSHYWPPLWQSSYIYLSIRLPSFFCENTTSPFRRHILSAATTGQTLLVRNMKLFGWWQRCRNVYPRQRGCRRSLRTGLRSIYTVSSHIKCLQRRTDCLREGEKMTNATQPHLVAVSKCIIPKSSFQRVLQSHRYNTLIVKAAEVPWYENLGVG